MATQYYEGIGRRKRSTARVRIMSGSGQILINEKPLEEYFPRFGDVEEILAPIEAIGEDRSSYDITVLVSGGGITGQRDSIQLGISRALILQNSDCQVALKKGDFLTRDPRIKERKKPGLKRARKAPTYTKR